MSVATVAVPIVTQIKKPIHYPDSDGKPVADNTKQFRYIVMLKEGLDNLFRSDPNVFVAGDLLWYPREGEPKIRQAPDTMVVFGRPKGDRGSYMQWREGGIAPQVVFEVLSPGNTVSEMKKKWEFYEQYGVEEYYIYDPDRGRLTGGIRRGSQLEEIKSMMGWVSPRLGVQFRLVGRELEVYQPNGERLLSYQEMADKQATEAHARQQAEAQAQTEVVARQQAEAQVQTEVVARQQAEARAQQAEAALQAALAELERLRQGSS